MLIGRRVPSLEGAPRQGERSRSAQNEALVRRYVEEVPGGARGPEGIKRIVDTFVDAFPDLQVSLDDELSSGEKMITRWTARGTHQGELMGIAPTGDPGHLAGTGRQDLRSLARLRRPGYDATARCRFLIVKGQAASEGRQC
jgi:SnoaL-like polyketide cyclase